MSLALHRAVPTVGGPAARPVGGHRPTAVLQRRRCAKLRLTAAAATGVLQVDEPGQISKPAAWNVLSGPLAVLPFASVAASVAGVHAYTGVLFADNPMLRNLMCGSVPIIAHVILPWLDMLIGPRDHQPTEHGSNKGIPLVHILSCIAVIAWAWGAVATVPLQPLQFGLLAYTLGLQGTAIVASGHELIHSKNKLVRGVGELGTAFVNFWPYSRGHHQHHQLLGTPEDHSTARKGESVWAFMARYLPGHYTAAWQLEAAECARQGRSKLHNKLIWGMAAQAAFTAASFALGGTVGLALHLAISSLVSFNMTVFDYALHYGLTRDRSAGEPVTRALSFSTHFPLENANGFNGAHHSHHHVAASRPYGDLYSDAEEPTFPAPVGLWALLALVPPLWFRVMEPMVEAANRQHKQAVAAMA